MTISPPTPYDILLVGRTGYGKSTTGNKLLGIDETQMEDVEKYFVTGEDVKSVTEKCKQLSTLNTRVLDTPGFADCQTAKEHGVMKSNLHIFRSILREQERHGLAFRRVLYFLPYRAAPERADGALQEEIKVMYDFMGEDIFNIMVIIATNKKEERFQRLGYEEEDIKKTKKIFTVAFEEVTGQHLLRCPPLLYLPFNETDVLSKVQHCKVIEEGSIQKPPVFDSTRNKDLDTEFHNNPGKRLHFKNTCSRCAGKLLFEASPSREKTTLISYEGKDGIPEEQSKCHPIFIPKYSKVTNIVGGYVRIALVASAGALPGGLLNLAVIGSALGLGWVTGIDKWPGFTNSEEICPVCRLSPGSEGCSLVGKKVKIGNEYIQTLHSTNMDKIVIEV